VMKPRIVGKPLTDFGGEERPEIVHHHAKFAASAFSGDNLHERKEFLGSASWIALPGDLSGGNIRTDWSRRVGRSLRRALSHATGSKSWVRGSFESVKVSC
jgi:hypothetical protein